MATGRIKKGEVRNPKGRPRGLMDARSTWADVAAKCEKLGFDPVEHMINLARGGESEQTRVTATRCILERVSAALKSVEHSTKDGQIFGLTVVFSEK